MTAPETFKITKMAEAANEAIPRIYDIFSEMSESVNGPPDDARALLAVGDIRAIVRHRNALAAKCEALERERDALDRGLAQAMSDTEAAMRTLWETAARVRSLEEALTKVLAQTDIVSDLAWAEKLREPHLRRMLALAHSTATAALSDTPREEWDPSGFDIKHDPNEPLPSYHWDFEDAREEGKT